MGRLRNLAQTVHEFVTNHIKELDVPGVADGDDEYEASTKIALQLLKGSSTLLNAISPGVFGTFGVERIDTLLIFVKLNIPRFNQECRCYSFLKSVVI
jgi:hypothetical protein